MRKNTHFCSKLYNNFARKELVRVFTLVLTTLVYKTCVLSPIFLSPSLEWANILSPSRVQHSTHCLTFFEELDFIETLVNNVALKPLLTITFVSLPERSPTDLPESIFTPTQEEKEELWPGE